MVKGIFYSVEGIDEAAVREKCSAIAKETNAIKIDRKVPDFICDPEVGEELYKLKQLIWPANDRSVGPKIPVDYWAGLQCAWVAAIYNNAVLPRINDGQSVVINGWYYKFLAKICAGDATGSVYRATFAHLPNPDTVYLLKSDIHEAYRRKRDIRPSAFGVHQGIEADSDEQKFSKFQLSVEGFLLGVADDNGWIIGG